MTIYLDFDQTVNSKSLSANRRTGSRSIETIKLLIENKHRIILNTARVEIQGDHIMNQLYDWFSNHEIHLHGNTSSKLHPLSYSRAINHLKNASKFFIVNNENNLYIDDIGEGVPITQYNGFEVVDWNRVKNDLIRCGMIIDRSAETGTMIYRKSQDQEGKRIKKSPKFYNSRPPFCDQYVARVGLEPT
jgi:hypothetical protein